MRLDFAFRLSAYVTLGLACACLAYAEFPYLHLVLAESAAVVLLLVAAFVLDSRGVHLSIRASNIVGVLIFAVAGVWAAYQSVRRDSLLESLPWPASWLPALAPVLMLLIPAKLFRPKDDGDHWVLQGIGLMCVAMACALAGDLAFAALLAVYAVAGVWCLALFYLRRTHGLCRSGDALPGAAGPVPPASLASHFSLGRPVVRWSIAAAGLAVALFLSTPRHGAGQWELAGGPGRRRMEVGFPTGGSLDLNRTGTLSLSDEIALEVFAQEADGRPHEDLDPFRSRFSGRALDVYANGTWSRNPARGLEALPGRRFPFADPAGDDVPAALAGYPPVWPPFSGEISPNRLPDLGPGQYFLNFRPQVELGAGFVVAEPVAAVAPQYGPVQPLTDGPFSPLLWRRSFDGSLYPTNPPERGGRRPAWRQVTKDKAGGSRSGFVQLLPSAVEARRDDHAVPGLREWTTRLVLRRLDALPPDVRESVAAPLRAGRALDRDQYEAVGRLLADHLAHSGEFAYSLNLKRSRADLDPAEDFLFNTRQGHCERFASALALMCRSLGIPSQLVVGFRGCERREGHPGTYLIRQSHAHAWVEILVPPARPPEGAGLQEESHGPWQAPWIDRNVWQWLTLDPTPDAEETEPDPSALGHWFERVTTAVQDAFRSFIVEYDSKQRDKASAELRRWLGAWWGDLFAGLRRGDAGPWAALFGGSLLVTAAALTCWRWLARRARRPRRTARSLPAYYARLLTVLAGMGRRPAHGQTPREFAEEVRAALPDAVAAVPAEVTDLYYRARFGGTPPTPEELARADDRLASLAVSLRRR